MKRKSLYWMRMRLKCWRPAEMKGNENTPVSKHPKGNASGYPAIFFQDSKLDLNARSFYFYRDNYDNKKNEAWALGGALSYKSGP